ncbi:MAG: GGDEF domain-containing protein, partial [Sideroxyarcus sp.]|nr:GGDEF domain-containing protein [Sideroxyarcus sp.]
EVISTPETNAQGEIVGYHGITREITARKQLEDQVKQLAFYDTLTNLPNRRLLNDRLTQSMAASKRSSCYGALIFLDLDNFKLLNDSYGHDVGDLLLIEAATRLKSCVREMDTVARFGGDEFVVILNGLDVKKPDATLQVQLVAEKILASLSAPYLLTVNRDMQAASTVEHHCTASIGVAMFIDEECNPDDILKWADGAMYEAKHSGGNSIEFYVAEGP